MGKGLSTSPQIQFFAITILKCNVFATLKRKIYCDESVSLQYVPLYSAEHNSRLMGHEYLIGLHGSSYRHHGGLVCK